MTHLRLQGIAASDGVAVARAVVVRRMQTEAMTFSQAVPPDSELVRLNEAVEASLNELRGLYEAAVENIGQDSAKVFEAHQWVLQDPEFIGAVRGQITSAGVNAETAVEEVTIRLVSMFDAIEDEYIKARGADIRDVGTRVMRHLQHRPAFNFHFSEPVILAAYDLSPSETAQLDAEYVRGFVTVVGSVNSHSAIIARAMGIPAVVGTGADVDKIEEGSLVIVNGTNGVVIVGPDAAEEEDYRRRAQGFLQNKKRRREDVDVEPITFDGRRVEVSANISSPNDVGKVVEIGADGVGLFRSEFLYMNRDVLPTEDEQFVAYHHVALNMRGRPVVIRTLDIGGDKEAPYLRLPHEMNPFLGYRGIRICLSRHGIFKTQLRSILRASCEGNVRIMFPMISSVYEVRQAKRMLEDAKQELRAEGVLFDEKIEVGVMVETPACALTVDIIAEEVEFFSIGTNDLIQYTMACDRMNPQVSYLYQPYHPAILRLVDSVIRTAHHRGKRVAMCGEFACDRLAIPILLGMGLDEFSMSPTSVADARRLIRSVSVVGARRLAEKVLLAKDDVEVQNFVEKFLASSSFNSIPASTD